jgi:hypothetical protein
MAKTANRGSGGGTSKSDLVLQLVKDRPISIYHLELKFWRIFVDKKAAFQLQRCKSHDCVCLLNRS